MSQNAFETIFVKQEEVACDGGAGVLGHPRIYMHIDRALGQVTCPYCSRCYILEGESHHHVA